MATIKKMKRMYSIGIYIYEPTYTRIKLHFYNDNLNGAKIIYSYMDNRDLTELLYTYCKKNIGFSKIKKDNLSYEIIYFDIL